MKQLASEKIRNLGLDVEFLVWFEGEEPRLPDLERVRKVDDADFAAAIRAAEWLAQHFSDPGLIAPHQPERWLGRYELLEQYLHAALGSSLFYHVTSVAEDLDALERVMEELLPQIFWQVYRDDIRHLRKQRLPLRFPKSKAKPSGGRKQSEQTVRMRVAVTYVSSVSKMPYGELARLWNERLRMEKVQFSTNQGPVAEGSALGPWRGRHSTCRGTLETDLRR